MNLSRLFKIVLNKWYIIVLAVLLCLIFAFSYTYFFSENYYVSEGKLYVSNVIDESGKVDLTQKVIGDIIDISLSDSVLSDVAGDPALQVLGYSTKELRESLAVNRTSSGIVVVCNTSNPMHSQIIVQAYLNSGIPRIKSILEQNSANAINLTVIVEPKEGIKAKEVIIGSLLIAAVAGAILGMLVVSLPYMLGKKPHEPEHLTEDYDCKVLGILPKIN